MLTFSWNSLNSSQGPGYRGASTFKYIKQIASMMDRYLANHPQPHGSKNQGTVGDIYVDVDGYGSPTIETPEGTAGEHERRLNENLTEELWQKVSTYHYLLRSTLVLDRNAQEGTWDEFIEFSRRCKDIVISRLRNGDGIPNPPWIKDVAEMLVGQSIATQEQVSRIKVKSVLRPQIFAYSFPASGYIEVSAVTREHLRSINLILFTMAQQILNPQTRNDAMEGLSHLTDTVLPYIFSLYYSKVSYSRLPILRAPNAEAFERALMASKIQAQVLVAHEYAHMLLHADKNPSMALEREADEFAYNLLFEAGDNAKAFDVYSSSRWLFLYLSIDQAVGATLSGYEIDWIDLPMREREDLLIPRVAHLKANMEDQLIAGLGDLMLFHIKHELRQRGSSWIRDAGKQFQRRYLT